MDQAMADSSDVVAEFRKYCGEARFDNFVFHLHNSNRASGRLKFWQEQLWAQFQKSINAVVPSTANEIGELFQAYIPVHVLHWHEMKDDELYVVDLVQEKNGRRYLRPRRIEWPADPDAAFTSEPATGAQIRNWQCGQAQMTIRGTMFVLDAHGVWMTVAEMRYIFSRRLATPKPSPPAWVNGLPPLFPPK
jgi:hypothetical protein